MIAPAVEQKLPVAWVAMDNASYGVISGIEKRHLGGSNGCMFEAAGKPYHIDFTDIVCAFGANGIALERADQLASAIREAFASGVPTVFQVPAQPVPPPTTGYWEINSIYRKPNCSACGRNGLPYSARLIRCAMPTVLRWSATGRKRAELLPAKSALPCTRRSPCRFTGIPRLGSVH